MNGDDGAQPGRHVVAEDDQLVAVELAHVEDFHCGCLRLYPKILHQPTPGTLHGTSQNLRYSTRMGEIFISYFRSFRAI